MLMPSWENIWENMDPKPQQQIIRSAIRSRIWKQTIWIHFLGKICLYHCLSGEELRQFLLELEDKSITLKRQRSAFPYRMFFPIHFISWSSDTCLYFKDT